MKRTVIGIDVGKYELSLFCKNKSYVVENSVECITKWFKKHTILKKENPLIVYEPTGGYERQLQNVLNKNNWSHKRIHANHIRSYAKALGVHAKTDKVDAKIIADYAERMEIKENETKINHPELKALLTRREQLVTMRAEEKNRLDTCDDLLINYINQHIDQLTTNIAEINNAIEQYEEANKEVKKAVSLYASVPGIGHTIALQSVVDLPELEKLDIKKLSALVGLAPWNRDSGLMSGKRRTYGGRTRIRGLLYMAAVVSSRCCPQIKQFYLKLKQKGKASKVALIAVAHKLLAILHSIAKRQTPWVEILDK